MGVSSHPLHLLCTSFAEGCFISEAPQAHFIQKSTHCLGRQMCAFFCQRVTKRSIIEVKVSKSSVAIKNIAYTPVLLLIH